MGEKEGFNIFKAMAYIDRKYLFLMIFVVVLGPILFPVGIPIKVGKNTKLYYSYLDELESGDVVYWIGATYRTFMEVKSGYVATLRTIIEKDAKLIVVYSEGDEQAVFQSVMGNPDTNTPGILTTLMEQHDYKYMEDYVELGMILVGGEAAYVSLARNFQDFIHNDYKGTSIEGTFLDNVHTAEDIALIIHGGPLSTIGPGGFGRHFALDFGVPYIGNMIGVTISTTQAWIDTGIVKGMLESGRGGAELEFLIGHPGVGLRAMDCMTLGHYYFIALVIIGNIGYFGWERQSMLEEKRPTGDEQK